MKTLQDYKQQMHELKQKIDVLEKELALEDPGEVVNVEVRELQPQLFEHFIEVPGNVEADLDINVSPESIGVIERILVTEGQNVSKGQVLAVLNIETIQRSIEEMQVQFDLARTTYERQKNLWDQKIGSEMQLLQAKANMEALEKRVAAMKAQVEMAEIKSPVDGIVDIVYQKKGQIGSPQTPFARVLNISTVKVYGDVSESYLTKVNNGDRVVVSFPALSREVNANIYRIGNVVDPDNRTFRIRINMSNNDRFIKPNLICTIRIRDYSAEDAIVIPSILIKEDFVGNYTYVAASEDGKNVARKVYITPGTTNNNMTEVVDGLAAGMKIISEGFTQIADGTNLSF